VSKEARPAALSHLEREVLNAIQEDFPLVKRPFRELAARLGRTEEEILGVVRELKQKGIIRRIGASFDSGRLNLASTLVAMKVPPERLEEVASVVSSYPEVTHNYQRDHRYNLWFAVIAARQARLDAILQEIKEKTGILEVYSLPARRRFKIRVKFEL